MSIPQIKPIEWAVNVFGHHVGRITGSPVATISPESYTAGPGTIAGPLYRIDVNLLGGGLTRTQSRDLEDAKEKAANMVAWHIAMFLAPTAQVQGSEEGRP